jgi:hypothetical protein
MAAKAKTAPEVPAGPGREASPDDQLRLLIREARATATSEALQNALAFVRARREEIQEVERPALRVRIDEALLAKEERELALKFGDDLGESHVDVGKLDELEAADASLCAFERYLVALEPRMETELEMARRRERVAAGEVKAAAQHENKVGIIRDARTLQASLAANKGLAAGLRNRMREYYSQDSALRDIRQAKEIPSEASFPPDDERLFQRVHSLFITALRPFDVPQIEVPPESAPLPAPSHAIVDARVAAEEARRRAGVTVTMVGETEAWERIPPDQRGASRPPSITFLDDRGQKA